jgi:hypothetical protein
MAQPFVIRRGWMRFMYAYTIVGAGGFGLGLVFMPQVVKTALGWPGEEPLALSIVGSVYVAFGLLSVLGLRDPVKYAPVLLLQLGYKSVWFIAVALPMIVGGRFPGYGVVWACVFASYIVGDLIAVPFRYLFARDSGAQQGAPAGPQ